MHHLKVQHLLQVISAEVDDIESEFRLGVNPSYLEGKGELLLKEVFESLNGTGKLPVLEALKFDFKINRFVFIYDDEIHFNRYRLNTLKTGIYDAFSYPWLDAYKRLCRTYEKDCLKAGVQERIWNGPPLAGIVFGKSEENGDLSGNGSAGWKLNAYNDAQYDLISRLHGYKLIRIPQYETLMIGGGLKKLDDLLRNPKEEYQKGIVNWLLRKIN
ncbi:DUF7255 family protein [Arthrospiribacter ruber]|uniref:Uncharacterized protein n=1 Tax=Arthrospiribacter ruber TaxID=2487934 RepID=A0A951MEQ5_9BACT|nr:hypothetical protein [Arthrospiribacter ruber]MBW3468066.1 hypothetical protein [Arthrospiribacter ruber]